MEEMRNPQKNMVGKREGKRHLGRKNPDGKIILKLVLSKRDVREWTGSVWLRAGTGGRLL
jgi:hypothetical protein